MAISAIPLFWKETEHEVNQGGKQSWGTSWKQWWSHALFCSTQSETLMWNSFQWDVPVGVCYSHVQLFGTLWTIACYAPLSRGFSRQEYWSGLHTLLQGIFPTQGSNPGFPHCRWILYHLSHQGSPRIPEWVVYPFSRGNSWPRNQIRVSCIAGRFLTS